MKRTDQELADRFPYEPWAIEAGFPTIYEAENAGCFEHNAHEFREGKRLQKNELLLAQARAKLDAKASREAQRDAACYRPAGGKAAPPLDPLAALEQWVVTDEQVQAMKATRIIWRDIIASTHLAAWIAQANGGKTTLARTAAAELAPDFKVLYFQEDASAGDLPALHEHAQAHGYKMLNSTLAGSNPADQIDVLQGLVQQGTDLDGFVMFFDTLKKYADLMSKTGARGFFQLMRALTQRGATVVLLGHTNKHKGVDGKLIFEGVGDVRNDVDELIYIDSTEKDAAGVVTLTMRPDKVRCAIRPATFSLDTHTMTVRPLDRVVDVASILAEQRRREEDAPLIDEFRAALSAGGMKHTDLINSVVAASDAPRKRVQAVFDRYCSQDASDPAALWLETRMRLNNTRHISLKPGGHA